MTGQLGQTLWTEVHDCLDLESGSIHHTPSPPRQHCGDNYWLDRPINYPFFDHLTLISPRGQGGKRDHVAEDGRTTGPAST